MPSSRTESVNYNEARKIADLALHSPNGITVAFTVEQCGTYENCKRRARSLQSNFTSMRAKARIPAMKARGEESNAFTSAKGPYDRLTCYLEPMPGQRGYWTIFRASAYVLEDLEIRDFSTGERIDVSQVMGSANDKRMTEIVGRTFRGIPPNPDECEFIDSYMPTFWEDNADPRVAKLDAARVDLASLEGDEIFGGGDAEGVDSGS